MKYPLILKYTYSFIISGNYYKEEVREYYELFSNEKKSKMVSINSVTDIKVNVNKLKENEVTFEYIYIFTIIIPGSHCVTFNYVLLIPSSA